MLFFHIGFVRQSDEEDEPILKSRKRKRQKLNHVSDDDFPVPIKVETELYEEGEEEYIDDEEDDSNSDQVSISPTFNLQLFYTEVFFEAFHTYSLAL